MKNIRSFFSVLRFNAATAVQFELLYHVLTTAFFLPALWWIFRRVMVWSGYRYITLDNVFAFARHPGVVAYMIFAVLLIGILALFEVSTLVVISECSYKKIHIDVWSAMDTGFSYAKKLYLPRNILFLVLLLLFLPLINFATASGVVSTVAIPDFISDYIAEHTPFFVAALAVTVLLHIVLVNWIFCFHFFVLEDRGFIQSLKKSHQLMRGFRLKILFGIFLFQLALSILYLLLIVVGLPLVLSIGKIGALKGLAFAVGYTLMAVLLFLVNILGTPGVYAILTTCFHAAKEKHKRAERLFFPKKISSKFAVWIQNYNKLVKGLFAAALASCFIFSFMFTTGMINPNIEYLRQTEITAHRGASRYYPENTMAAFRGAKELGADWIELDVQQSKDGKIYVMHDSNFKRTCGVDANSWETEYEEIAAFDAGSFFSREFAGEKVPLLEEVIVYAKENMIRLNIELKPTGHEKNFEKAVVDLVKANDFTDRCVLSSLNYSTLERIKAYDPDMPTLYVMALAYGDITQFQAADHFSVEATSVNKGLIRRAHNRGSEMFVWTVNSEDIMERMLDLNVDNLITDDIPTAQTLIEANKTSDILSEYIKFLNKIF